MSTNAEVSSFRVRRAMREIIAIAANSPPTIVGRLDALTRIVELAATTLQSEE